MIKSKLAKIILASIILFALLIILLFAIPSVRSKVLWRLDDLRIQLVYALNPPEEVVFVPEAPTNNTPNPTQSPTETLLPTSTSTPDPQVFTATATIEPTALPSALMYP